MRENQTVTPPWQADVHVSYVLTRYERYQGQLVTETTGVDHYYTYHENAPSLEAVREAWQDGDYEVSDYRLTDLHTRDTWDE